MRNPTEELLTLLSSPVSNLRAPAGSVLFGGNGGKVYSQLTNQAINADDFCLSGFIDVPLVNPVQRLGIMSLSSSNTTAAKADGVFTFVDSTRTLRCRVYGNTTAAYKELALSLVQWAGKCIWVCLKRVGAVATLYVNRYPQNVVVTDSRPYAGTKYLAHSGATAAIDGGWPNGIYLSTPNAVANQITGDITIDAHLKTRGTAAGGTCTYLGKALGGNGIGFALIDNASTIEFRYSTNGSNQVQISQNTGGLVALTEIWVRVTRRQSDGVVRVFYSADGAAWTQLGTDVISNAGTAMFASTAGIQIGDYQNNINGRCDIYRTRLYDGFEGAGTLKQEFKASDATNSTSPITSSTTGEVWTLINTTSNEFPDMIVTESTTWARSITNTYLNAGLVNPTISFIGKMREAVFWNIGLTDAEVIEIYENDGVPPPRYQLGSQVLLNTANPDTVSFGADTLDGLSATGFHVIDASQVRVRINTPLVTGRTVKPGETWLASFTATLTSGAVPRFSLHREAGGAVSQDHIITAGVNSVALVAVAGQFLLNANPLYFMFRNDATSPTEFTIASLRIRQAGAVVWMPMNEGIGFQLHDLINKLDGVMSVTDCEHTIKERRGFVRTAPGGLTWTATHESKSILGQRAWPNGCVVERITVKPSVGSSGTGLTAGDASTANRFVTSVVTTTAKKVLTLAEPTPAGTSDAQNNPCIDPDSANYTGAVEAQFDFVQTEG